MKHKLSLSLLTCLAISGGGYLFAEELNTVCNGTSPCDIGGKTIEVTTTQNITQEIKGDKANISVTGNLTASNINLTGGSFKNDKNGQINITNLTGSGTSFTGSANTGALFKVDNFTLKDKSNFYIWHNGTGNTFVKIGTLNLDNSTFVKNSTVEINKAVLTNGAEYRNSFYTTTINELEIDSASKYNNAQGGSTIKKITNTSKNNEKVTLNAGGSLTIGDSASSTQNSMTNIDIKGSGSFEVINMKLDSTNKIEVDGLIFFNGKVNVDNMDLSKTTSTPNSHKLVIKDGSDVVFNNVNLTNQSINANGRNDTTGSLTIKGGTFKDVNIGGAGTNLANLTLEGLSIDNGGLNKNNNITAQNITINNITTSNNANINAKTKLNITGSTIDNTNNITATSAEIGTSTIGANINVTNELKATSGANLNGNVTSGTIVAENGSVFNGTTKANDSITANSGSNFKGSTTATNKITSSGATFDGLVSAKDLESLSTSKFNNNVNITNSITASDTTFAKDVTANTITANNGSVFSGTTKANDSITANSGSNFKGSTTATNKITSSGATFDGLVSAKDLESSSTSKFNNNVNITNSITASDTTFAKDVTAGTITANDKANFNGTTTANTITANNGSVFNSTTKANDSITANNGSKFNGTTTATNKITSSGATFDGVVNTADLISSANSTFNKDINASNQITSSDTIFKANVTTTTLNANSNSKFEATSTINANDIIANSAVFDGNISKLNSIKSDNSSFSKDIEANDITATNNSKFTGNIAVFNDINSSDSSFSGLVTATNINANKSSFSNKTTAMNKLTANNSTFTSGVHANDLETLNNSSFSDIVDINNSLIASNSTFANQVNANTITANNGAVFNGVTSAKDTIKANAGSSFAGNVSATNSIISDGANFSGSVNTADLNSLNNSSFSGIINANNITSTDTKFTNQVNANNITANIGSIFSGVTSVKDTIIANTGSSFAGSTTANTINASNAKFDGTINANTITAVLNTNFASTSNITANTINSSNSQFNGAVNTSSINSINTAFNGATTIDCVNDVNCKSSIQGTYFEDLTLKNNADITLDKGSSANNLTLADNTTHLVLDGNSKITGDIKNEGVIEIVSGKISSTITGSGDLKTQEVIYEKDVSLSDIKGSGGKFQGMANATNDAIVDNVVFDKDLTVGKTLYANQGNEFGGKVSANAAVFSLDTSKSMAKGNKVLATDIDVATNLKIQDLNVNANTINAKEALITNSNVSSLLLGSNDSATNVYAANIAKDSGTYTSNSSELSGGVRVDKLNTTNTHIKGQVATNTLNASNTTFYIYGKGTDTSFHDGYSGAIIAREGAIGSNNTIQLANTNLAMLKDKAGFIPIAIIGHAPTRSDALASSSAISEDFFRVTYQSKVAKYELVDRFKHFNSNVNGNAVWSIGVYGDDLVNASNIDSVIAGDLTSIANGSTSEGVKYNSLEVVYGDLFDLLEYDESAVSTANFILTSPDYIATTKNSMLNNRFRNIKKQKVGNGFWLDNQMGYNKYEYNSIRYKNINVGADKTREFSNSNFTLGLAASFGRAETKGTLISDSDSKSFGIYAMSVFNNGVFVGANAFYHNIASSYEASNLGIKADKTNHAYTASIESGVRFGDKYYFEPSLRYDLISYTPTAISQNGLSISGDKALKHILSAKVEGGVYMLDSLDGFLGVGISKELSHKPDMLLIDEVKANIVEGKKGDTSVNINFGLDYKVNQNASFNIDLGSNLYTNSDKELKGSLGFSYKF